MYLTVFNTYLAVLNTYLAVLNAYLAVLYLAVLNHVVVSESAGDYRPALTVRAYIPPAYTSKPQQIHPSGVSSSTCVYLFT